MMFNLHDFLVEHATFPSPQPNEGLSAGLGTTDISAIEVPLLEREWKANHAVRDNTLVQNFAILSRTSSETLFCQRMTEINSYCGFHLGYSLVCLAEKTTIGKRIQANPM